MVPRFLTLSRIVQRAIIGAIFLAAFLINLRFFKSSDTANLIAGLSFIAACLMFGMLGPTIFFVRCLLKFVLFYLIFLRD
jgi:hypothetical protein